MSYVLVYIEFSLAPYIEIYKTAENPDLLIHYLIHNQSLMIPTFILKKEDFKQQKKSFLDGDKLGKCLFLTGENGKLRIIGTEGYFKLGDAIYNYIKDYNNYLDTGKYEIFMNYKNHGGKGSYYFTFKTTMIKHILDDRYCFECI